MNDLYRQRLKPTVSSTLGTLQYNNIYRPQCSCGKVIFSQAPAILSIGTPPGRHPPMGRHPPGRHPPCTDTPLGRHTSLIRHPPLPGRHPPSQSPPGQTLPPRADTPSRRLLQRTVRILLEWIPVYAEYSSLKYAQIGFLTSMSQGVWLVERYKVGSKVPSRHSSVGRAPVLSHAVSQWHNRSHQCLFTNTWIGMTWLPCSPLRGQQVSHQRWIWGFHCTQATKHACEGIHPGFKT